MIITAAGFVGAAYYEKDWHIYQHIANKVTADYILKLVDHGANVTAHQAFFAVRHGLLKPGEFDIYVFLGVCGMVFLAWQLPRFHHFMMRNFVHSPIKGSIRTMFTSTLSHASIPHLLFNGIAMYTIGLSVYHRVGPAEFWAFCTGAASR
ncbi:hypothetical protein PTSG_09061 [Salpingoeca rosetta]|uniref:Peptidase S54 rhomboid domain-containing protein n=1 Tax=Salpingoeca rosetta (strain ATCC 50818 / BSB-021) TaxID=946362 RepID=F2UM35_SALR5|nr:uncharacterized protein PTSG_09061 [Salpingoeca rosetta]EGD78184.1 hypothetical protein PTSG_09061 [Salpingoeca rosetta]|eukprot:XP_004989860.1 hypothetical protein PTSG_09061 [Salpingoeca rosetta]